MKRLIVLSLIMAEMVLMAGFFTPTRAQGPANDLRPTFINPTPGLYVNGWPAFAVSYPKEWEVMHMLTWEVFRAGAPRPNSFPSPMLWIYVFPNVLPLEDWTKIIMPLYVMLGTDIKVLSDKPSQLKDGTPAREVQVEWVSKGSQGTDAGRKVSDFHLITKKDVIWVDVGLSTDAGKAGEDVKRVAYSLTFLPGREEPVQVPPDVRAFFDMWCTDAMSHDVKTIMDHYSDRFRHSGTTKKNMEQFYRNDPFSPIHKDIISLEATVTVFEPRGDKTYVDGFLLEKVKGSADATKIPMMFQQIINEHGEWKWYGNQK